MFNYIQIKNTNITLACYVKKKGLNQGAAT